MRPRLISNLFAGRPLHSFHNVGLTRPKTPAVWLGQTITRSCSIAAPGLVVDATVDISVIYKWLTPWLGWRSTQSAHFSGRHGEAGYFLVPDLD